MDATRELLSMTLLDEPPETLDDLWHVALIQPGKEIVFVSDLRRYRLPYFIPLRTISTRYASYTRIAQRPEFSGYCFLSGDAAAEFAYERLRSRGFQTIMQGLRGDAIQKVIRRDVYNLHRLLKADAEFKPVPLGRGVPVRVVDRANGLYGCTGRVVTHDAGKRLVIEFRILGDIRAIDIDELAVEIIDEL